VNHLLKQSSFTATDEKGSVSALMELPSDAKALLVLAHGAGANMHHVHMESITRALARQKIATFRFNFPFMEAGGRRTDSIAVCVESFASALAALDKPANELSLFIGGHSFGGRMSSHFVAQQTPTQSCRGLIYFSFPLHGKNPDVKRADHLASINLPMLFLSGTRDTLAEPDLLKQVVEKLPNTTLHWLETADHGFKILKRTRESAENVYDEAARVVSAFIDKQLSSGQK